MSPPTAPKLPANLVVLERGWLSSNNILALDGNGDGGATLIDSGYVTHAPQTVHLVRYMLGGRRLTRLVNTHVHSDHIGGNAALQAASGCRIRIPVGSQEMVRAWDDDALLLRPLGQSAARFAADATLAGGDEFEFGGMVLRAVAVPGHDDHMLALYCAEKRLLISGDALWRHGFGILFSTLLGNPEGFSEMRRSLETLGRLGIDLVIPGHGAVFADADAALKEAFERLDAFEADAERLARHALKVLLVFRLLDLRRLPRRDLADFLAGLPMAVDIQRRFLDTQPLDTLADQLAAELVRSGGLREDHGVLVAP
jgi:glyoxylase-like metal-dependent hydrolase (beta-lactamase superfamily II)